MAGDGIRLAPDLLMPLDAVTEKFAIIGNSGMGKSTAATTFVEQFHACGLPSVVLDVKGDWRGLRSSRDGTGPGLPFVIFGGEHGDVPLEPTAGALVADTVIDYQLPAIVDMSLMSKRKARTFATAFAEQLYVRNRDPLMVVVDEADVLIPQRPDAETWRLVGAMEDIAKRGRGRGLGLTIASQRGQEVNQSVLDIMGTVILLGMTGRLTIKAVRDWIGVNADSDEVSAREVIGSLPSLQVGEAWIWSPAFLRLVKRVQIDMFTTYDSHFTPKPGQRRAAPVERAEIDLAKVGEEIAATVERAQATDPRALRAQVTALTRRNTELQDRNQELQAALEAARTAEPERVEVPAPLPEDLVTGAKAVLVALDAVLDAAAAARSETDTVMRVIDRQRTHTATPPPERADGRRPAAGPALVPKSVAVAARVVPAQPRVRDRAGSPTARESVALRKAERAVLTVCWRPTRRTRGRRRRSRSSRSTAPRAAVSATASARCGPGA